MERASVIHGFSCCDERTDGRMDALTRTDLKIARQPSPALPTTRIRLDGATSWPWGGMEVGWGRQGTQDGKLQRLGTAIDKVRHRINHSYCYESRLSPALKLHFVYAERANNRPSRDHSSHFPSQRLSPPPLSIPTWHRL